MPKSLNYKNLIMSIFGVLLSSIVGVFVVVLLVHDYLAFTGQM